MSNTFTREVLTTGGYELAWDSEARAGFLCVEHGEVFCVWGSARTVELDPGLNIDLDSDGRIRGIETIGHRVGFEDLVAVIRWVNNQGRALS